MLERINAIDTGIISYVCGNLRFGFLTSIMVVITTLGEYGGVWLIAGLVLAFMKKYRRQGITILCSLAACFVINNLVLQNIFQRVRPFNAIAGVEALVHMPSSFSFPSGHTSSAFASAFAIRYTMGKKAWWVFILAALIGISRVYLGVHYPTDVIAGAAVGSLISWGVCTLAERIGRKRE